MKSNRLVFVGLCALACSMFSSPADDITASGSGEWGSTVPDAPWPNGIVPGTNDSVDVEAPFVVTITTNATAGYVYGSGTITLAPDATLTLRGDEFGAQGAQSLSTLNATAPGSTVIYEGNAFWAKRTDYFHLIFRNLSTNQYDFFNGAIPGSGPVPMNIAGDLSVLGRIKVQQGADIFVGGDLIMGTNSSWDVSSFNLTVTSNTTMRGLLLDLDGASGSNYFGGNMLIGSDSIGWNISDVIQWGVGGSLTNDNLIVGRGYGSITFAGSGVITGKPIRIPTMTVSGSYLIGTTITLTTNTPTLTGNLIFDLANTNQLILQSYPTNPLTLYYDGNLNVINTGAVPTPGTTYKFFSATNYDGAFDLQTFPPLPVGLAWEDNLLTSGSITVSGSVATPPMITSTQYDRATRALTLVWTSSPAMTYSVIYSATLPGSFGTVLASGIPSGGAQTSTAVTLPAGDTGFVRVLQE